MPACRVQDGKIKRLAGPLTRQQSAVLSSHDLATAMAALGPSAQDSDSVREDSIEDTCSSEGGACSGQEAASGDVGGSGHVATVSAAAPAAAGGSGLDCTSSSVQHAPHPDAQYACDETADISLRNGTKDTSHQQHLPVLEQQQHPIHAAFVAGHAVAVKRVTSSCILAGLVAGRPRAHTEDGAAEAFGIAGLKV